jgi:hypothetical protein
VHKRSNGGDYMQVGTYTDGAPNTTGAWVPLAGVGEQRIDASPGWGMYHLRGISMATEMLD